MTQLAMGAFIWVVHSARYNGIQREMQEEMPDFHGKRTPDFHQKIQGTYLVYASDIFTDREQ